MSGELDPQQRAVLDHLREQETPPLHTLSVEAAREAMGTLLDAPESTMDPVAAIEDGSVPGPAGEIPVRTYRPHCEGTPPLLLYLHGGGFVLGDLDGHDATCRTLAAETGHVVVSVGYRLAPEHPFPEPVKDAYAAAEYVSEHAEAFGADPERTVIAGDSAGGNLATVVCLLARERGGPAFDRQVLVYPGTNSGSDTDSYEAYESGYLLSAADMRWFWSLYLPDEIHSYNPCASPLQARDLSGLPPATILTAEFDPLRDEGIAYADRLADADVDVTHRHYETSMHGFFSMVAEPNIDVARDAHAAVASDLEGTV